MLLQALCIISYPLVILNLSYSPETPNLGQMRRFFEPCDLEIWRMTLKNNRAPLLCYFKLCAAFRTHWWIQTGVTVRKHPIWVKFDVFYSRVTLKFDGWPSKTIGHLFYATSSFVHHFIAIGEFKLQLQSGNAQSGSNSAILAPCHLEIWRMTLKNNRAPLLSNINLYVSFHHHMWIQTGVTVRKRKFGSWPLWPWPLTSDLDLLHGPYPGPMW